MKKDHQTQTARQEVMPLSSGIKLVFGTKSWVSPQTISKYCQISLERRHRDISRHQSGSWLKYIFQVTSRDYQLSRRHQ